MIRPILPLLLLLLPLSGCAAVSVAGTVVGTAVDVAGTAVSTTADVVTAPLRDDDDEDEKRKDKDKD